MPAFRRRASERGSAGDRNPTRPWPHTRRSVGASDAVSAPSPPEWRSRPIAWSTPRHARRHSVRLLEPEADDSMPFREVLRSHDRVPETLRTPTIPVFYFTNRRDEQSEPGGPPIYGSERGTAPASVSPPWRYRSRADVGGAGRRGHVDRAVARLAGAWRSAGRPGFHRVQLARRLRGAQAVRVRAIQESADYSVAQLKACQEHRPERSDRSSPPDRAQPRSRAGGVGAAARSTRRRSQALGQTTFGQLAAPVRSRPPGRVARLAARRGLPASRVLGCGRVRRSPLIPTRSVDRGRVVGGNLLGGTSTVDEVEGVHRTLSSGRIAPADWDAKVIVRKGNGGPGRCHDLAFSRSVWLLRRGRPEILPP